jgi:hypothetical protein
MACILVIRSPAIPGRSVALNVITGPAHDARRYALQRSATPSVSHPRDLSSVGLLSFAPCDNHVASRWRLPNRSQHCLLAGYMAMLRMPTPIAVAPAMLLPLSPNGRVFSSRTKPEMAAIQRRFMTPPTNSRAMRIQQQPRQ